MKKKTLSTQTITEEEEGIIEASIAEFRKEKRNNPIEIVEDPSNRNDPIEKRNDTNETNEDPSNQNNIKIVEDPSNSNYNTARTFQNSATTPHESYTQYSQLSVALPPSLDVRQNKNTNPAFFVADIPFSTDASLLSTTRNISGNTIQYDDNETINLVVDLQTSSLAPLLNPDTKEITKTESNLIQQIEMKRWNTSTKKQIYDINTGMKYKKINRRPKIQLLKVQEGTV